MKIREIEQQELELKCVDLISKTYIELGQTKTGKEIVILSQSLSEDLRQDFDNSMEWIDIEQSFRNGVRRTEQFHLSVKTYYKWITTQRQLIWDNNHKEPQKQDKRLHYRTRKGTGMTQIQNKIPKKLTI
tara:strand:- start:224 stop:613 length:390 start_codon:yes stop_codon:yes gene_type:complete